MRKSSLQYKRYTREELIEATTVWDATKPTAQIDVVNNYLALQRVVETQQKQIDLMKARWIKMGRMIQGMFQRKVV